MECTLCEQGLEENNIARFPCGHTYHLSCIFLNAHQTSCPACQLSKEKMADIGTDRGIAVAANTLANIQARQLRPSSEPGFIRKLARMISPLTPHARTFRDHMNHNKRLSVIKECGFAPSHAVHERVQWSDIATHYEPEDILDFGFTWSDMVSMGIQPSHLKAFTWSQQQHQLKLDASHMLQIRMTITELASLRYSTHQLIELGFDWNTLSKMGANVETWTQFKFDMADIKRYWAPTLSQWLSAGFYDKDRVERAGWPMEDIIQTLPAMNERHAGRQLRLAF